jgi:hypothetical protein
LQMDRCILVYWKRFKIFFSKSLYFGIRDFFLFILILY